MREAFGLLFWKFKMCILNPAPLFSEREWRFQLRMFSFPGKFNNAENNALYKSGNVWMQSQFTPWVISFPNMKFSLSFFPTPIKTPDEGFASIRGRFKSPDWQRDKTAPARKWISGLLILPQRLKFNLSPCSPSLHTEAPAKGQDLN